ncbi:hypothetical protein ACFO6R_16170 [Eubacterium multiforme]|uniref:Membrane protein YkgB n=1 Tax=Eubacterium multiforme TaxID=83339 RepID=A0ABT9UTH4_9FIRM|nr:hypothetical protein [Eubacterium multiforme]MDQ0149600.1 putative membrane protein YkgB [Eubacterium multiforme]
MYKKLGILLISISLLIIPIVISINKISFTLKEVASGNFGISSIVTEIPWLSYMPIPIVIIFGIILITKENNT